MKEKIRLTREKEQILQKTAVFAQKRHEKDRSGHDFEHIRRVCRMAEHLMEETDGADVFIVKMGALLHDIDDWKLISKKEDGQVSSFLASLEMSVSEKYQIEELVRSIGFSNTGVYPELPSLEMKIVFDADKLDAMGAMGICRTLLFGADRGTPLFLPNVFPKESLTREEYKNLNRRENTSINHFFDKLLRLKDIMQTPAGKKEALVRHQFMVDFLRRFFEEQGYDDWLAYLENWLKKHG